MQLDFNFLNTGAVRRDLSAALLQLATTPVPIQPSKATLAAKLALVAKFLEDTQLQEQAPRQTRLARRSRQ